METILIFNGLGNQMSQYALFLSKKQQRCKVTYAYNVRSLTDHNGFELDRVFGIKYPSFYFNCVINVIYRALFAKKFPFISNAIIRILYFFRIYSFTESKNYDYNPKIVESHKGLILYYGGWHSEKYFIKYADQIRGAFKFDVEKLNLKSLELCNTLPNFNAVSLHVRRGDYLSPEHYNTFGCVCDLEYYNKAIEYIQSNVEDPIFIVFSNDVGWVRDNIENVKMIIVDFNVKQDSWMDMFLMTCCQHNIISNSTFSWWGAWLNLNVNKIIVCPKMFINNIDTKDIYPESWIKI